MLGVAIFAPNPSPVTHQKYVLEDALPHDAKYYYDTVTQDVECQWHPGETWNASTLTRDHFSKGIKFASAIFSGIPDVRTVTMMTYAPIKDVNGNTKEALVLQHRFLRLPFMKIQWDNFKHETIVTQLAMCTIDSMAFVSPVIGDLKRSDVYYAP